jgi:hypothetical protein
MASSTTTRHFIIRADKFRDVGSFSADVKTKLVKQGLGHGRAMNGWVLKDALNYAQKAGWEVFEFAVKPR